MKTKNLMFQVSIPPNGAWTSGKKKFGYSNSLYNYGNNRAKNYAAKWGAEYFCLRDTDWLGDEYAPVYHKFYVYKLFEEGYDKIAFVDSDAAITKICPNIWEFDKLSAVRSHWDKSRMPKTNRNHSIPEDYILFQTGTVLFTRDWYEKTKDYWREELPKYLKGWKFFHDQSVFNVLTAKYYGSWNELDFEWGAWWKDRAKYITQFNGFEATDIWNKDFDNQKTLFEEWEKTLKNN